MRAVLLLLAACGVDARTNPHDVVDCIGYTAGGAPFVGKCELACEMPTSDYLGSGTDMPCTGFNPAPIGDGGGSNACNRTSVQLNLRGCCLGAQGSVAFRFWACE